VCDDTMIQGVVGDPVPAEVVTLQVKCVVGGNRDLQRGVSFPVNFGVPWRVGMNSFCQLKWLTS
jgi:hypothetical protein